MGVATRQPHTWPIQKSSPVEIAICFRREDPLTTNPANPLNLFPSANTTCRTARRIEHQSGGRPKLGWVTVVRQWGAKLRALAIGGAP